MSHLWPNRDTGAALKESIYRQVLFSCIYYAGCRLRLAGKYVPDTTLSLNIRIVCILTPNENGAYISVYGLDIYISYISYTTILTHICMDPPPCSSVDDGRSTGEVDRQRAAKRTKKNGSFGRLVVRSSVARSCWIFGFQTKNRRCSKTEWPRYVTYSRCQERIQSIRT